ncbi:MAG: GMP synthase (glutamine-hydrolyzing) [Psychromonas sp.]|jgi:GMP synthase (glutamine-hydrolysing)
MKIAILDFGSTKVPDIESMVDDTIDFETFKAFEFKPELQDNFIGIILSGAPILVTEIDMEPYFEAFEWLKKPKNPILGICFGHQLIGILNGAFASKMKEDRDSQEIEFYSESILCKKMPQLVSMMEDHCEAISIPSGFKLLGSSDVCINEAMEHNEKPWYGVQFHPETSGNMGFLLIENFINHCIHLNKSH